MACQSFQSQPRCLDIALEWDQCGHIQKLDFMPGDCEYADTLDHTHHKKTLEKVAAPENIPCPTCESGVTTPQLRTRIAQLDAMLQQHVTEGGFSEWQAEHPEVPTHPWQATQHITSAADLQRHLLELESLLLCGFGLSTSNQTTPRAPGSPASAVAARPSTTPPPSAPKPRFSILRGATGFRREFFPGVQWDATRLSRKETAKRREAWRREHGT